MKGFITFVLIVALTLEVVSCADCPADSSEVRLKHEDCNKFYHCVHGKKIEQLCPADLFYNEELDVCDWPKNVNCVGRNLPVNTTASITSVTETVEDEVSHPSTSFSTEEETFHHTDSFQ